MFVTSLKYRVTTLCDHNKSKTNMITSSVGSACVAFFPASCLKCLFETMTAKPMVKLHLSSG